MIVQRVDNALRVVLSGTDDVAFVLLCLESGLRESLRNSLPEVTLPVAKFARLLANLQIHAALEIGNLTLGLAATVLQRLNNIAIAHVYCVYNPFCGEAYLPGYLLNCCLYIAAALLQSVEVDVKGLRKLAQSEAVSLDSLFDAICVLVVL